MKQDKNERFVLRPKNPYELLANEIVLRAVEDYRLALKHHVQDVIAECERFFRSRWYRVLTNVDGEFLIQKLRNE